MNRIAKSILPTLREEIKNAADPLFSAIRYCISVNVMDKGAYSSLNRFDVLQAMNETYQFPLAGDYSAFKKALQETKSILYITDNAGEIADMIISKRQGNFESLSDERQNIWFLFKIKCPVIAREANLTGWQLDYIKNTKSFSKTGLELQFI